MTIWPNNSIPTYVLERTQKLVSKKMHGSIIRIAKRWEWSKRPSVGDSVKLNVVYPYMDYYLVIKGNGILTHAISGKNLENVMLSKEASYRRPHAIWFHLRETPRTGRFYRQEAGSAVLSQSCLCATPWPAACQAPLSMGFSRPEYWSGLPCPPPGDLPNPGIKPGFLHCRQTLYHLSYQGNLRILEWVAYPFSRGSSQPRNQTGVSCITGGFFTSWATREAQKVGQ